MLRALSAQDRLAQVQRMHGGVVREQVGQLACACVAHAGICAGWNMNQCHVGVRSAPMEQGTQAVTNARMRHK